MDCLVGLLLRRPPQERKLWGSIHVYAEFFESYQLLKTGTPVATLPGAWSYRVKAGTVWPGVSIL